VSVSTVPSSIMCVHDASRVATPRAGLSVSDATQRAGLSVSYCTRECDTTVRLADARDFTFAYILCHATRAEAQRHRHTRAAIMAGHAVKHRGHASSNEQTRTFFYLSATPTY
jgi:hypothetical protein